MKQEIKDVKVIKMPSAVETLKAMRIGETRAVKYRQFKQNVVRSAMSKLKTQGYLFEGTEKGLFDRIIVTRLK